MNLPTTQELPLVLGISKGEEEINSYFVSTTYSACTLILTGKVVVIIQKKRIHFSRLVFVYVNNMLQKWQEAQQFI